MSRAFAERRPAGLAGRSPWVRHVAAWLTAIPLAAAGMYVTRLQILAPAPVPSDGHAEHVAGPALTTGVAFFCTPAFLLAIAAVLPLVLLARTFLARNPASDVAVSGWPFGIIAPLAYFLHNHFEHLLTSGLGLGWIADPRLLVGLLLQVPVGILAMVVARALLRVADRIVEALTARKHGRIAPAPARRTPALLSFPRIALIATSAAPRAPPAAVSALG